MTDKRALPDTGSLAADWVTIWQSEVAALAVDREMQEASQRAAASWAARTAEAVQAVSGMQDASATPSQADTDAADRWTWPAAPPGSAPVVDAPDARDTAIANLTERVAELERWAASHPNPP